MTRPAIPLIEAHALGMRHGWRPPDARLDGERAAGRAMATGQALGHA